MKFSGQLYNDIRNKFWGDLDHQLTLQIGNLGNMGVMNCIGLGGLCSLSALVIISMQGDKATYTMLSCSEAYSVILCARVRH